MKTINISDFLDKGQHIDDCEKLRIVDEQNTYFDSEKGFQDIKIVLLEVETGNYYPVEYTNYKHGINNLHEQIGHQVFPKTKTITVYE